MIYTSEEILKAINDYYPDLKYICDNNYHIVSGLFSFIATYDSINQEYIINPGDLVTENCLDIVKDSYEIKIIYTKNSSRFPTVFETGGRLEEVLKKTSLEKVDLHMYNDNSLCLVGAFDVTINLSFIDFLDGPLLQYFYDQSYFSTYKKWPRGEYSHGILGIIENYYEKTMRGEYVCIGDCFNEMKRYEYQWQICKQLLINKFPPLGIQKCLCGSGKTYLLCHQNVFYGLQHLHQVIPDSPISTKISLFQ